MKVVAILSALLAVGLAEEANPEPQAVIAGHTAGLNDDHAPLVAHAAVAAPVAVAKAPVVAAYAAPLLHHGGFAYGHGLGYGHGLATFNPEPLVAPTFNPEPLVANTFNPEPLVAPTFDPAVGSKSKVNLVAADAHVVAAPAPVAYHAPAPNCVTNNEVMVTQNCVPSTENICNTITVDTEEIEYVKLCMEFTDILCDAPVAPLPAAGYHAIHKREAEADADADASYGYAGIHHAAAPLVAHAAPIAHALPVAHAVGHSISATVRHACREVTTERCVDNPQVIVVPIEVEHCHVITKVACSDVENLIPVTTCEAVTNHIGHAAYAAAPVLAHAPVAHHAAYAGW